MKKILGIILFMSGTVSLSQAGFHMGLGSAGATTGRKVFEKAAQQDALNHTGDNAAQFLPPCGNSTPYTVSVVPLADIAAIDPLGHVNPPGHTFPSDHIYFYIVPVDTNNPVGP